VRRYNGPANGQDFASSVAVSADGSEVFVTGGSHGNGTGYDDYATVAYEASSGAELWVTRYTGFEHGGDDAATSLAVSPDGSKVFVTGASGANYATLAYNTVTGARLWVKRYRGPVNISFAVALTVSPDGSRVFVTGSSLRDGACCNNTDLRDGCLRYGQRSEDLGEPVQRPSERRRRCLLPRGEP
jgi:DNA-binding beta-propeller fold protein YncE